MASIDRYKRRVDTIQRKAERLFTELMEDLGPEAMAGGDNITDYADNLTEAAHDLYRILTRAKTLGVTT